MYGKSSIPSHEGPVKYLKKHLDVIRSAKNQLDKRRLEIIPEIYNKAMDSFNQLEKQYIKAIEVLENNGFEETETKANY